jgi:hypothetical protein
MLNVSRNLFAANEPRYACTRCQQTVANGGLVKHISIVSGTLSIVYFVNVKSQYACRGLTLTAHD